MKIGIGGHARWLPRTLGILLALAAFVRPALRPTPTAAARADGAAPLDLKAADLADGYRLDFDWEAAADVADRTGYLGGAIDVYEIDQLIQGADTQDPGFPLRVTWRSRIDRFGDVEAAAAWLRDRSERPEVGLAWPDAEVRDLDVIDAATTVGDEHFAVY